MQFIVGGRGQGKTTAVLTWFLEDPYKRAIVCVDTGDKQRLIREINKQRPDLQADRKWTYNIVYPQQLPGAFVGKEVNAVCIDNFDLVLRSFLHFWGENIILTDNEAPEVKYLEGTGS